MQIEPWQIPVLVMAGIATPVSIVSVITWVRQKPPHGKQLDLIKWEWVRTTALALLTVVMIMIFVLAVGANTITAVASAIEAIIGAWLTLQPYLTSRRKEKGVETPQETSSEHAPGPPS